MNPSLLLAVLGAFSLSKMIGAIAYYSDGQIAYACANVFSSIGFYIMLSILIRKLDDSKEK
ncbi:hypothetical protein SFC65_19925 [Priestia filamentosa]|uniref:hypothetical protein n=1 Tax=Priestia filamentosa TaxID=1402861 RepID=UPI00398274AF